MADPRPPVLRRLPRQGGRGFQDEGLGPWLGFVLAVLVATTFLPIVWPSTELWLQRTTPLLSLFFFLAAIGHWLRMGARAFAVAFALTAAMYLVTAWTPIAVGYEDFFVVALISSFLVFALAGFNLVFVLEEMVFDAQRLTDLRGPAWRFVPTGIVLTLAWVIPLFAPSLRVLWVVSIVNLVILGGWWFLRAFNPIREGPVLKELHLLVAGTLLMAAIIDATRFITDRSGILPSFLAFVVLVGTWIYVSYTTLQRTHFLLGGNNGVPWLLIMLSASFALVQHASLHFRVEGSLGVGVLLNQRLAYLVGGMGIGMAVYVAEGLWRVARSIRDDRRFGPRGRIIAGRFARVAEGVVSVEQRLLGGAAYQVYAGMDRLLPGPHIAPEHPGWELDQDTGKVYPLGAAPEHDESE